jgi:hypothetical protein
MNRGNSSLVNVQVTCKHNRNILLPETINMILPSYGIYEFSRNITTVPIGNNVYVEIDTNNTLMEYTKSNNHVDAYLDQFWNVTPGQNYIPPIAPGIYFILILFSSFEVINYFARCSYFRCYLFTPCGCT